MRLSGEIRHFSATSQDDGSRRDQSIVQSKLSGRCVARYQWGFSWSLYLAQSANRTRLNRQPSLRCSVEMTYRGMLLVLGGRGEIAQMGHDLYVDNMGNVSDQVAQVHMARGLERK